MSLAVYDFDDTDSSDEYVSDHSCTESSVNSSCSEFNVEFNNSIQKSFGKFDRLKKQKCNVQISANIGVLLWNRETQWSSHLSQGLTTAGHGQLNGPLVVKSEAFRKVRLREIIQNPTGMIEQGHVFLGFTQDARYLLSYSTVEQNSPEIAELNGDFYAHQEGPYTTQYFLHFWSFRPFIGATTLSYSVRLFEGALNTDTFTGDSVKISVSQWLNDDSRLVVVGFWEDFNSSSKNDDDEIDSFSQESVQIAISVVSVPDNARPVASDIHTVPVSSSNVVFCDCHPIFQPKICLVIPDLIILKCDQFVLLYRLTIPGFGQETTKQPENHPSRVGVCRKRKFSEEEDEKIEISTEKFRKRNLFFHQIDPDSVMISKAFQGNGSSNLIYWWGEKRLTHRLEPVFRDVGIPQMFGKSDSKLEIGSILIENLMKETFRFLENSWDFASLSRTYHDIFTIRSVNCESQEIVLQACLFVSGSKRQSRKNQKFENENQNRNSDSVENQNSSSFGSQFPTSLENQVSTSTSTSTSTSFENQFSFPFLFHVNYVTGSCFIQYHRNGLRKLSVEETGWDSCQKLDGMLTDLKDFSEKNSHFYRNVHSMDNFGVSRGSATSLISPDGFVEITL